MMADIMEGIVGKIDLKAEAKMHLGRVRASIANTMSNPLIDDPRIHHVRYKDFVADPIGTIRGYYEFTGRELTPQAEAAMRDYLANNKGDRHGKFHYSTKLLTDAGEDIDALQRGVPALPRALRRRDRETRLGMQFISLRGLNMSSAEIRSCPVAADVDRRKSAPLAAQERQTRCGRTASHERRARACA